MKTIVNALMGIVWMMAALQLSACGKNDTVTGDTTLTPAEKESLAFMREEEKMAFDVYSRMYSAWGLMPFQNIKQSESTHMAAVKTLLDKYGLPDPAAGKGQGEFSNAVIAGLYTMLVNKGDSSEVQALTAGALIEEVDIRDLKEQLLQITKADIQLTYDNLMKGSRNHLRSFVTNLSARGITYVPQYLSQAEFDAIINSPMETGGGFRRGW